MSGIFGDLDVSSASDDPFNVDPGIYDAYLTDVKVGTNKAGDKRGMTFIYTINGGDFDTRTVSEWKQIPTPADPRNLTPEESMAASFLKMRLKSLGVPDARMNSVEPDDLIGARVVITVKKKDDYTNVSKVVLADDNGADDDASDWLSK